MQYSHIVVGGGSAGCVVAARLSERSANRVLLVEAGPDFTPGREPAAIRDGYPGLAYLDPRLTWADRRVTTGPIGNGGARPPLRRYEQARVMGGGSTVNGQLVNRGLPSDYDEWARRGATGWGWEDVLPWFRRVETDLDRHGPLHGTDGPLPIRRVPRDQWPLHARALAAALTAAGLPYLHDQNGDFGDGHYELPICNVDEHRVSAAMAWLTPAVRDRPNLHIRAGTAVTALTFDGVRATGVALGDEVVQAGTVVLSAGALATPELLLRAGIGPGDELEAAGMPVRVDLPGVGRGLSDHPSVGIACYLPPAARLQGRRRNMFVGARFSTDRALYPSGDMGLLASNRAAWHAVGERLGLLGLWINRPLSEHGRIRLAAPDPALPAEIDFNFLSDGRDVARLVAGFRRAAAIQLSAAMAGAALDPFPASYSERVRRIGAVSPRNRAITRVAGAMLDGPPPLRRWLINRVIAEGDPLATLLAEPDRLEAFVRARVAGLWHASCSCRMGGDGDRRAVLTPIGEVRGVHGLRVADASAFPAIPSANTNLPVVMLAEKMAGHMLER